MVSSRADNPPRDFTNHTAAMLLDSFEADAFFVMFFVWTKNVYATSVELLCGLLLHT
jgi:hypothetical protein